MIRFKIYHCCFQRIIPAEAIAYVIKCILFSVNDSILEIYLFCHTFKLDIVYLKSCSFEVHVYYFRNPEWGIRDIKDLEKVALDNGMTYEQMVISLYFHFMNHFCDDGLCCCE